MISKKKLLLIKNLMKKSIQYHWNQHDNMFVKWRADSRYAGDEHPFLLILAIVIIVLDISLTITYVNSGKIDKK